MAELGNKWECSECGTKFYDLGRAEAACPQCSTRADGTGSEKTPSEKTPPKKKTPKKKTAKKKTAKIAAPAPDAAKAGTPTEPDSDDIAEVDHEVDPDLEPTLEEDLDEDA